MRDLDRRLAELRDATQDIAATPQLKERLMSVATKAGPRLAPASRRLADQRAAKGVWAQLQLKWARLPDRAQSAGLLAVAFLGIATFGKLTWMITHPESGPSWAQFDQSKTVFELTGVPTKDCFGIGPGVTHTTSDKAQFEFNFPVTAKKALATLRFTAGSVAKGEEVDISVGAVHQGFVNRSFGDDQRGQEVPLSAKYLKPNDKNHVVFDNLKNPPGQEQWVICNVAVEVQQLPAGTESELREQARADILNGDRFYQDRLIAAVNRYNAWKSYRRALLYLEAMDIRIDEYDVVKQKIRDTERELDAECATIMLNGAAAEKQNKIGEAIGQYKHGLQFFPEKDHACFGQIRGRLDSLE